MGTERLLSASAMLTFDVAVRSPIAEAGLAIGALLSFIEDLRGAADFDTL
jgi:hypothetical protein